MSQFGDQGPVTGRRPNLVPLMNVRLLRPARLIDLNGIRDLNYAVFPSSRIAD
jgi:hypothetical protein